jgi:hypothetical protein
MRLLANILLVIVLSGCSSGFASKPFQMEVCREATWRDIGIWVEWEIEW